ncbi:SslE/AcfD family lipoprotein zinc metalloprotease, partial [Escherichia coli]|nr:SslE/AcfD family lipoprotein zinc metalloprotease [Escherichia coli]MCV8017366.1 SslE/AcfD family lipoprotein zinc metalloprotease [Escherichia coli]MCV8029991.1 SslE/AcfD family lipoprotein zinc metalloprotease [Escherichia coli]
MNKKLKYKKSLLAAILSATLLAGCDGGGSGSSSDTPPVDSGTGSLPEVKPDPTPNPEPTPEPTPDPEPTPEPTPDPEPEPEPEPVPTKTGYLTLGGSQRVTGATCNGESSDGFTFTPGEDVTCVAGNTTIATFNTQSEAARSLRAVEKVSFSLEDAQELAASDDKKSNALSLVTSMNSCPADTEQVCLEFSSVIESKRFDSLYKQIDLAPEEFKKLVNEEVENNAATDKAPSTHTSPVVPVTTPGTKPDLNASFVSANAEQFYQYQPTEIILSEGRLVDSMGNGVVGVNYYTSSGRGVTGENGKFNFSWGETISFGIDTFELGSVRGNKSTIALTELGDEVRGANIDQLIHRYSTTGQNNTRVVPDDVRKVFAEYPNVINEIINLSLSNGATLDEGEQVVNLPNEFIEQFKTGQAKEIDTAICAKTDGCNEARWFSLTTRNVNDGQIQGVINKLWGVDTSYKSVSKFHVFHDSTNFYGSTGNARGQAVVNISNSAFPILMARNDKNYWLAFGEKRAWDKNELAYITEAPSIVQPENVTRDTATFNLPFISLGQVGEGKLMVIGNPHYNSILRCPNGYSWGGGVNSKGECTLSGDSDDMKHFMQNVLRYLSNDIWQPNTKSIMTVGTNLENVYFKKAGQVLGNSAPFAFHEDFTGITVKQLTSYGDLNPEEIPLLILNGFEYVTQWSGDPYAVPLRADTSKPKLTQQDVTDLIAYLNKGGSVLIMENVMSNLKEESASSFVRLLDAAGLSMALNKSVVNNDPQGYPDRVRQRRATGIWVYERYPAADGAQPPYTIDPNTGEVTWKYQQDNKPDDKPKLEVASWQEEVEGKQVTRYAFIDEAEYTTEESLEAAKAKIFEKFPGLQECKDSTYHYEINCLERRPGTDVPVTGGMYVPRYTQLNLDADTAKAMVQAADLGTNIQRLYQHELYFRTKGSKGERLNSVDLERLYQNMSVWLWNDTKYRYEEGKEDELGFKTFTEFLNCYANDAYAGGTKCSADLKKSLVDNNMIYGDGSSKAGMMNPSYPLNYMEKPLTRLMLGRSWWDLNIKVDVEKYPGSVSAKGESVTENISLYSNPTKWFAGNMQSTGLWAPAQQDVTIKSSASVPVTVTVALADDLTGREKHEVALNRPPRVTKTYTLEANGEVTFKVPYGGLIYIKGDSKDDVSANFTFTGVVKAPFYKDGEWKNDLDSPAPLGELESASFVYTTPKKNLEASNFTGGVAEFAKDLDTFASSMNDFYGRNDEDGKHRMFTYKNLTGHKHRFTNDVQISIGDAHSGYPVMNSSFSTNSTTLPT